MDRDHHLALLRLTSANSIAIQIDMAPQRVVEVADRPPESSNPIATSIERRDTPEEAATQHELLFHAIAEPPQSREAIIVGRAGVLATAVENEDVEQDSERPACRWVLSGEGRNALEHEVHAVDAVVAELRPAAVSA